jgi:hypothetical protein
MPKEICVMCGSRTNIDINTHVDMRIGYIEGMGQLCTDCYMKGSSEGREMVMIPKYLITSTPNDMELGSKVRSHYWSIYGDSEPPIENQWVCTLCGEDTSNVDYDYLVGVDHLSCHLKNEIRETTDDFYTE